MSGIDLSGVFGAAFAGVYGDGLLHRVTVTQADDGTRSRSVTNTTIKVQNDELSEVSRINAGYTVREARFLILQASARPKPSSQDEMTATAPDTGVATRYAIKTVTADPGATHWVVRAEKV